MTLAAWGVWHDGDFRQSIGFATRAAALGEQPGKTAASGAHVLLALALGLEGDTDACTAHLERALAIEDATGDRWRWAYCAYCTAISYSSGGWSDRKAALDYAARACEVLATCGGPEVRSTAAVVYGMTLLTDGDEAGFGVLEEALATARQLGSGFALTWGLVGLVMSLVGRDPPAALSPAREALLEAFASGDRQMLATVFEFSAAVLARLGHIDDAAFIYAVLDTGVVARRTVVAGGGGWAGALLAQTHATVRKLDASVLAAAQREASGVTLADFVGRAVAAFDKAAAAV
jgi:hypothetical protein